MACREYKDTLSAYIDDELKPLTRLRVEAHLRGCRRCRRQLRQTRRATEMVRGLERVEAPVFAMQRARSIALGGRARGWERLRGGLLSRPQTLPLKPVLLAGLAFMMVLVISQTFDTVVAPRMEAQTATPAPKTPPPSPGQPAPGLPGTLSADRLSDSQKAEIARRVLQAHPQQAPVQGPEPAVALPDEDASAQPATLEEMPQQAVELDPVQAETGRVAQAATEPDQALRNETASPQASGAAPAQQETRIAAAVPPTGALSRPLNVATPEAAAPTPTPPPTSADKIAAPAAARAGRGASPDVLELGETYRQVLVLAQRDDGQLEATFHAADIDRSGSLRRFDDGEPAAVMKGETAVQAEEDLPPPEPDLDTGIAPPLPVYRPAPVLRQQGRGHRELGPLSPALLRVNVLADGTVGSLALISSSGLRWLDRAVVEAVRAWEFRPAERHQQAVPVSIELLVEFELE
jgi:TonB family protein